MSITSVWWKSCEDTLWGTSGLAFALVVNSIPAQGWTHSEFSLPHDWCRIKSTPEPFRHEEIL